MLDTHTGGCSTCFVRGALFVTLTQITSYWTFERIFFGDTHTASSDTYFSAFALSVAGTAITAYGARAI